MCLVCVYKDLNLGNCIYQPSPESAEEASCTPKHPLLRARPWLYLGAVPTLQLSTFLTSRPSTRSAGLERKGCCCLK